MLSVRNVPSGAGISSCGKTHTGSFRRAGFARGICFFLDLAKKRRSLAWLGMTKKHFFRSVFSLQSFVLAWTKTHRLKPALLKPRYALARFRNSIESRSRVRFTEEIKSFNCSRFVALTMGAVMLGRASSHASEILAGVALCFFAT
jgi:hypothetical protein